MSTTTGMRCRLGVDVGGTFTGVPLVEEGAWRAKAASTPADQAGVLNGIGSEGGRSAAVATDMGPPVDELVARREAETGLPAPERPVLS